MTTKVLISLPQKFLEDMDRIAAKEQRSRSEFIREAVRIYMNTQIDKKVNESSARYSAKPPVSKPVKNFPNIEVVKFTGGSSAVIRGTRVPVHILIGYLQIGETPESISKEIIPHITLPQVHEAIQYYFTHQAEVDKEREENTEEASRRLLRKALGEKKYLEITGG